MGHAIAGGSWVKGLGVSQSFLSQVCSTTWVWVLPGPKVSGNTWGRHGKAHNKNCQVGGTGSLSGHAPLGTGNWVK